MEYNEEDFLNLSGLQHFAFCRRQWALIHVDGVWMENQRTAEGRLLHDKAHDPYHTESRSSVILSRAMPVFSRTLGLSGECDAVEFHRVQAHGFPLPGKEGLYMAYPVEYKRGAPKEDACDILQLTAQAMCLEEMLSCSIPEGALYYFETRHRQKVCFSEEYRQTVRDYAAEMHEYLDRRYLPRPKRTKVCGACSLKEECMPVLGKLPSARQYNDENLGMDTP